MRTIRGLIALASLALTATAAGAVITPIDSLNYDNASGVPLYNGLVLTVRGTVTCQDSIFQLGPGYHTDVYIQDAAGAVNLFRTNGQGVYHFGFGDSVEVTGTVKQFNGQTELDLGPAGSSVVHLPAPAVIPEPLVLTCAQLAGSYDLATNYEANQGRLVRLNGVHITSGSWPSSCSGDALIGIADASGAAALFIDKDTQVCGSPPPGATFNLIGILKQFDAVGPDYRDGLYEITPRYLSDVLPSCPGPQFTSEPTVTLLDSLSATVVWSTSRASTSTLYYGPTTGYGTGITDPNVGTTHSVTLTGLSPRSLYHMTADAVDGGGTCTSGDHVLVTFPSPGTPGDIRLWFNFSVDTTYATAGAPRALGNVDIQNQLISYINTATTSIDCALYSFSLQNVVTALVNAHIRGITVRLIMDAGNSTTYANQLTVAGISWITSTYAGNHGASDGGGIMHNKYVVVDAKSAVKDSAKVWTGSWNCSASGIGDCNNTLILRDWGLAQAYTMDFEQMWGGSASTPNSANAKLGSRKSNIIPHRFLIGGIPVEAYMSPSDQVEANLIRNIQASQHSQLFCILTFTSDPLSHAMKVHRDSMSNYVVRGLFDPSSIDGASEFCKLNGQSTCSDYWTPRADVLQDNSVAFDLLHHKYTILDQGWPGALVWTGSHNWSAAANTVNDENTVVIHDKNLANVYYQEWAKRYRESGGVFAGVDPGGATGVGTALAQSRPNPTRGGTTIGFTLPRDATGVSLGIYDLSGRRVRNLISGSLSAGPHEVRWDGRADDGTEVTAGMYFYRLIAGSQSVSRKLVLTR